MKNIQILESFEREINKLDDVLTKPSTDESMYWLNQAVDKFTKTRFNGDAPHFTSYEQNEKRARDLIKLFKEANIDAKKQNMDGYVRFVIQYPEDFMFALNENVIIQPVDEPTELKPVSVFECTADNFMYRITNKLTDFHYHHKKARPLRVRTSDGCYLLTDENYNIYSYTLGYIKQPNKLTLENPFDEYQDFPDYIMPEIIKIACQMFIENKSDKRYQTISNEVNTQE